MNELTKLLAEHTQKRREYAEQIAAVETRGETPEDKAKLIAIDNELKELEAKIQVELDKPSEPEPKLETVATRASVGEIYQSVVLQKQTAGAEAELQKELGLSDNQIPLQLLETRAKTEGLNDPVNSNPILPILFPNSSSAYLGIAQPTVAVGTQSYPALMTGATAATPAESAEVEESTGAFSLKTLTPRRIQASFFYSREDANSFAGMDMALRNNLNQALSDKLDEVVIADVLTNGTQNAVSGVWDFAKLETALYEGIEGIRASSLADLRNLVNPFTFRFMSSSRLTDLALSAFAIYNSTAGLRVSANVPYAAASKKTKAIIRRGSDLVATTPIWEGITLIPDQITRAKTGEIVVTAVMLYNTTILRPDGFLINEFVTAS